MTKIKHLLFAITCLLLSQMAIAGTVTIKVPVNISGYTSDKKALLVGCEIPMVSSGTTSINAIPLTNGSFIGVVDVKYSFPDDALHTKLKSGTEYVCYLINTDVTNPNTFKSLFSPAAGTTPVYEVRGKF